jgi:DNA-binding SARP family transcriptional activator
VEAPSLSVSGATIDLRSIERGPSPSLSLLGGFDLHLNGVSVAIQLSVQRVLAFLALRRGPIRRLHVAGTLWSDASEEHANGNLRSALWRVRRLRADLIRPSRDHLQLVSDVRVDVRDLEHRAGRLLDPVQLDPTDVDAAGLTRDLLPDWYDDWVVAERERLHQLRLHALEAVCRRLTAEGSFGRAVQAGLAAVAAEPLRESAHRTLIATYLAEGNVADAVRQFRSFRALLREELGVEPSPKMLELVRGLPLA